MSYAELHCHSAFSFRDGASHPIELAGAAAEQGYEALALTDHDGLYGSMELAQAVAPLGVRAITGAELTLVDGSHLTLLCEDSAGYRNLCRLITLAHAGTRGPAAGSGHADTQGSPAGAKGRASKTRPQLPPRTSLEDLERHAEGLVCLSGCARHGALAGRVERSEHAAAAAVGQRLFAAFGRDRLRVELQRPFARRDRRRNRLLAQLAESLGVACVATGNVHAHNRSRAALQDALVAVGAHATLDETEPARRGNSLHALASPEAMAARFRDHPEAVHETGRIAECLRFDLTRDLGYRYPGSEDPSADRRLGELCRSLLERRYAGRSSAEEAARRLERELAVIRSLGLSGFFLLHRDLLELAREVALEVRGRDSARTLLAPGRGRGSSVSSIVCYLTGLSHVDPVENELLLGRFLNEELSVLPDIDLDFPRDIREALIPRVHDRYGRDRSALVAAFAGYRARSGVRDFGKALGLAAGEVERVARAVSPWTEGDISEEVAEAIGARRAATPRWRALVRLVADATGLPRHLSQHPGGMVISTEPLIDLCPLQPAAMEGRQVVQWEKESCADAGFLKIDLLGLGMLSAVERCVEEIERARGERIDLSRIPYDDPAVYAEIQRGETVGVFQIESRAQVQMLRRTLPASLDELTVQVALVRPGPIIGGAVHPYIERRRALRENPDYKPPYEHPALEPVLRDTLGAIVFQDQVIEVAMALSGFSPGEAEGLRRAMSRKRSEAALRAYGERFVAGAIERGATREAAERVYAQIVGFSGFGFPKAHAAAFGLLAYQSTWLRVHHGPELLCSLLNEQPMGFYPPDALIHEAQRRGLPVLAPCVQASGVECTVEEAGAVASGATGEPSGGTREPGDDRVPAGLAVRIGLGYVAGVRGEDVRALVEERERGGPFASIADLAARCGSGRDSLERLAWAGACDALVVGAGNVANAKPAGEATPATTRREALWLLGIAPHGIAAGGSSTRATQLALSLDPGDAPPLPEMTPWERMVADYGSTRVTLGEHPLGLMRDGLGDDILTSAALEQAPHGARVKVAGMVIARQRPATAKGVAFMLLEDEHGTANLIVSPSVHDRHRLAVRTESLVLAEGRLERREGTTNVVVDSVRRLERSDVPLGQVRQIEPQRVWSTDGLPGERRAGERAAEQAEEQRAAAELRTVVPAGHSFGRRGR